MVFGDFLDTAQKISTTGTTTQAEGVTMAGGSPPVDRSTWQSDFSGYNTWLYVVDNNRNHYIVNHENQSRYTLGGAGSRNAARSLFGDPVTGVFLTNYDEHEAIGGLLAPNQMEEIISGNAPVPSAFRGSIETRDDGFIANPQEITAGSGRTYTIPESYSQGDQPLIDEKAKKDLGGGTKKGSDPDAPKPRDFMQEARAMFPSMPEGFVKMYAEAWDEHGDQPNLIRQTVRSDSRYTNYFPGNLDEDGSVIMDEVEYIQGKRQYQELLGDYGVPPESFDHKWADLVQERVSVNEFAKRAQSMYQKVVLAGPEMKNQYAEYFSGDISDAALFGSALDPSINPIEMEQQIRQAQVGAEAGRFGFDLTLREATRMAQHGLDVPASRQFFSRAKDLLPKLGSLVERHGDPDDPFDIADLEDALILQDPDEMDRIERLFAQEASSFSPSRPRNLQAR